MKTQTLGWLVGTVAVGCSFASCSEPATECTVGPAGYFGYVAVYAPTGSPTPAGCEMNNPKVVLLGDLVGMEIYHAPTADMSTYDDTKATIAVKTDSMGQEDNAYGLFSCTAGVCGAGCSADSDCNPDATVNAGLCDNGACKCYSDFDCNSGGCDMSGHCTINCGPMADGCGGLALPPNAGPMDTDCGGCPSGQTCGGGGTPNVCGSGSTCMPAKCADMGFTCGLAGDGCGGMLDCGKCTMPDTCGGAGISGQCGHVIPDANMADTPYALGTWATQYPDANDMCTMTGLSTAKQTLSSGPMPSTAFPADTVTQSWSNVTVYVTAANQGTQFSGDVTYTENGCSASYHAVGVWPAVDCTSPVYDPKDPQGKTIIGLVANQDACNPCAQPDKGIFVGSGISPDYPMTCKQVFATSCDMNGNCFSADPFGRDPYYCVLDSSADPPVLNPNPPTCAANYGGQ